MKVRSLGVRFAVVAIAAVLVTAGGLLAVLFWQSRALSFEVAGQLAERAEADTRKAAVDVRLLCQAMQGAVEEHLVTRLKVLEARLREQGGLSFSNEAAAWSARDQFTGTNQSLNLPRVLIGGRWLGQNDDPRVATHFVDEAQKLFGGTLTVFQRMNERGDMLRVATTVVDARGRRAVGTFIPAVQADGSDNPVLADILAGKRYVGRAFVVDAWYVSAYAPLTDARGRIAGMLYVGVPQEALLQPLRESLREVRVGSGGHVWTMEAHGAQRGSNSFRSAAPGGRTLIEPASADGEALLEESLAALAGGPSGGLVNLRRRVTDHAGKARELVTAATYFQPLDWIIGASADQEDFNEGLTKTREAVARVMRWSALVALATLLLLTVLLWLATREVTRPLARVVRAAEAIGRGDLTEHIEARGHDEVAQLGRSFVGMVSTLKEIASGLHETVGQLREVVEHLSTSAAEQGQAVASQAAALQQMQVATQELTQASASAASRAQAVLEVAARAEAASASGRIAVEQNLEGLSLLREQSAAVARQIQELHGQAAQIGSVTDAVKELAAQSHILALNASIEAARAGEQGQGFGVVAREVRALADQSVAETRRVGDLLQAVSRSVALAVSISADGEKQIERGLRQARTSGESLKKLSEIVAETVGAAHDIAEAVRQQDAGVAQLFEGVSDQSRMMDQTRERLEATQARVTQLNELAERVSRLANVYTV